MSLDLRSRAGWPDDLRVLLEAYPRDSWQQHENLGATAQFWLDRHNGFRQLGNTLQAVNEQFREGTVQSAEFRRFFVPRLQFFLGSLEEHHHIEDLHYFPVFRAAEARLERGFDVLEGDHEAIHGEMLQVAESANALLQAMQGNAEVQHIATGHYAEASGRLLQWLTRHLDDEEDLIVPVILDQGERKLFWGADGAAL